MPCSTRCTILAHAFDTVGLHRVHLDVYAFNTRAIRTYERLGFAHEGRARQFLHWNGVRHDALLMSMLRRNGRSHKNAQPAGPTRPTLLLATCAARTVLAVIGMR